ncbi:ATP-dependent DNA ligase [Mycobacterium vulneris]|nr:ATP-dependent DNA ligase [Mycolicibacterium vulneris]
MFDRLPDDVRTLARRESVPQWRAPMLATLTDKRFSDPRWMFELKLDGERCLAFRDGDRVRLLSRNRQCLNDTYPELADALTTQHVSRFVVDGEVVAFRGEHTSFQRLQARLGITDPDEARASRVPVFYYLFDVLHLDGRATTAMPLIWRKRLLYNAINWNDPLRYTSHRWAEGEAAYREACEHGDEGVIAKLGNSTYAEGRRSHDWLKFKCVLTQEFVVGGYTAPKGARLGLGALLVGYYQDHALLYAGKVGTGFDNATLLMLQQRLSAIERDTSPFTGAQVHQAGTHWTRPELVAEIGFSEWTREGKLRHPRYIGLRTDKRPTDVVRETPAIGPD